ncbi:MAG TPA: NAD(P)H-dependent oxidoreductase [Patescibacteria group bacterium]|jgi:chromate reductase|nr:NAD(P)H-dependent oxidoreductase [Patescibacteria group bacterium]
MKILGVGGTLRKGSYSKALLLEAQKLAPEGIVIELTDIGNFPLYNPDIEMPSVVQDFKNKVKAADAILFSTAEYNYSVPGSLKNALDWASRPYGDNSWEDKPAAIMSESVGMLGGVKAQYHLRQMMLFINMHPLNRPEVVVGNVAEKFNAQGNLTDEHTKEKIKELVQSLVDWTERIKK